MRVLIAGIIGAAVSSGAWLALEHVTLKNFGWLAIVVGLVTGIAIHAAAGVHARQSFLRGALAIILALAACVGGRQVYAKYMQKVNVANQPARIALAQVEGGEESDDSTEGTGEAVADTTEPEALAEFGAGRIGVKKPSLKMAMSEWDFLWLGLAALAAYVTGKGRDLPAVANVEASAEEPTSEDANQQA